jgi:hypothetical protein
MIASADGPTRGRRRGITVGARERGSGTVMALALIAVVLVLTSAIGLLAGAQSARAQAQAAADLAALAGASSLVRASIAQSGAHVEVDGGISRGGDGTTDGGTGADRGTNADRGISAGRGTNADSGGSPTERAACGIADQAARRNGAQLTGCAIEPGAVLRVTTSRRAVAGLATATARAGPVSARASAAGGAGP